MEAYQKPGVYEREVPGRIFPSPIPQNNLIALLAEVPPSRPFEEPPIELMGLTPHQLQKAGIVAGSVEVTNIEGTVVYEPGIDYNVTASAPDEYGAFQEIARTDLAATETFTLESGRTYYNLVNGRGAHNIRVTTDLPAAEYFEMLDWVYDPYTNRLNILANSTIPRDGTLITVSYNYGIEDGEPVRISYQYADAEYYEPMDFADISDIFDRYGEAWTVTGEEPVHNPVSLMAELIFANTSTNTIVRVVPINPRSTVDKDDVNLADWQAAIASIVDNDVALIVETSGNYDVHSSIQQHIRQSYNANRSMMAVLGWDGTQITVDRNVLRAAASTTNYERVIIVSTEKADGKVFVAGPETNQRVAVGNQYLAGALVGQMAGYPPQEPMTRKQMARVASIGKAPDSFLNRDTTSGLCVFETLGNTLRVRHGITTMYAEASRREISVRRAQDFMLKSMKFSLDAIAIGKAREPNMDLAIAGAAMSILDRMVSNYVIRNYETPQVVPSPTDETEIILRFTYTPNWPINRILIEFAIGSEGAQLI